MYEQKSTLASRGVNNNEKKVESRAHVVELVPFRIIFYLSDEHHANWIVDFLMVRPTWTRPFV